MLCDGHPRTHIALRSSMVSGGSLEGMCVSVVLSVERLGLSLTSCLLCSFTTSTIFNSTFMSVVLVLCGPTDERLSNSMVYE